MDFDRLTDATLRTTQRAFATGRTIIYTPAGGSPVDLAGRAVFRAPHVGEVFNGTEVELQTLGAELSLRLAELPVAPSEGDAVSIDGEPHLVASVEVDGEGGALIRLEAQ